LITSIHPRLVEKYKLEKVKLAAPIQIINADGSDNRQKASRHAARVPMKIGNHYEMIKALILDIGSNDMLLGLDWLAVHNPSMDWINGTVTMDRCPKICRNYNRSIKRQIRVSTSASNSRVSVS
jgi:hypothetical protein